MFHRSSDMQRLYQSHIRLLCQPERLTVSSSLPPPSPPLHTPKHLGWPAVQKQYIVLSALWTQSNLCKKYRTLVRISPRALSRSLSLFSLLFSSLLFSSLHFSSLLFSFLNNRFALKGVNWFEPETGRCMIMGQQETSNDIIPPPLPSTKYPPSLKRSPLHFFMAEWTH